MNKELNHSLTDWIVDHSDPLGLQVAEMTWPKQWKLGVFDFQVQLNVDSIPGVGRGIAASEDEALDRAASEALERIIFKKKKLSSYSGVALHPTLAQAKHHAAVEALERDSFFCHYLTRTQPAEISDQLIQSPFRRESLAELENAGITFRAYSLPTLCSSYTCYACVSVGHKSKLSKYNFILGLGCSNSPEEGLNKAYIECVANTIAYLDQYEPLNPLPLAEFSKLTAPTATDHFRLALSMDVPLLFSGRPTSLKSPHTEFARIDAISVSTQSHKDLGMGDWPEFHFSSCDDEHFQNIFHGKISKSEINRKRLENFKGQPLPDLMSLETTPHPLG